MLSITKRPAKMPYKLFLKMVFTLAIPVACQNLLTTTGSMIDTVMIGRIGETAVGAVGLAAQFSSLMFSSYWGLLGGGILFFSQYWGSKDEEGINRSYGIMLSHVMAVAAIFSLAAILFPEKVMSIYTDKEIYQEVGAKYLRIVGFSYPLTLYSMSMCALLRSTGQVKIPFFASIASVVTNVVLNWILIFGKLGAPALGVEGAAIATVCAGVVNVGLILVLSRFVKFPYLFQVRQHFRWKKGSLRNFYQKCFPIVCNEVALGVANLIINMVLGRQAQEAIAALAVFRTFESLVITFFSGFSSATAVLVGNRVGSGELDEAHEIANRVVYLCAGTILLVCLGIYAFNGPLLTLMGLGPDAKVYASGMLLIYCGIAVVRMSNWISNDTCRASGDAVTGTLLEIVFMYALNLPLLCLSGLVWRLPFLAVFVFSYIDEPFRCVLMQFHMHSGGWVRPVTEQGRAQLADFREKHPLRFFWTRMGLKKDEVNGAE